jgi:hypothetical protein
MHLMQSFNHNSIRLAAGPESYKSYSMRAPFRTHWRPATCEEYECEAFRNGFVTTVDLNTDLGQKQYNYLSHDKSRSYHMQRVSMTLVKFVYGPGNRCFNSQGHRVPVGRPPRLLVVGGDWRGNPRGDRRVHSNVDDWVDDARNHQDKIARIIQRG